MLENVKQCKKIESWAESRFGEGNRLKRKKKERERLIYREKERQIDFRKKTQWERVR